MRLARIIAAFAAGMTVALALPALAMNAGAFADVHGDAYYADAVSALSRLGIVRGYDDGRFGPEDTVTRGQVAVMLNRYDRETIDPLRAQLAELRKELGKGSCGDGILQTGEECDDGNDTGGDSCSAQCQNESVYTGTCTDGHAYGETYLGADGCNMCTCTAQGIACTKKACPPETTEHTCRSSVECGVSEICTTELGECLSSCPPGQMCTQVCTGVCKKRAEAEHCKPYVCADGTTHPSCSEDGHQINYFAPPCMTHGGEKEEEEAEAGRLGGTCAGERADFEAMLESNASCKTDADCMVFEASCPFVTCGAGINKSAEGQVRNAADDVVECVQSSGQPVACAECIQQNVTCVSGVCTLTKGSATY